MKLDEQRREMARHKKSRLERVRRFRPRTPVLLAMCCLINLSNSVVMAGGQQRCRVAVLADKDSETLPLVPLLETRLSQQEATDLLERRNLPAIMQEQNLSALSGAVSCADRLKIGRLAHADLLVIITRREARQSAVRMVVSETRQGLRLRAIDVALSADARVDAETLVREFGKARRKLAEGVARICAVPPFVSLDLTPRRDPLQAVYAHMLEELLLGLPGTLVVDMDEARAIGQEMMLGRSGLRRGLPLYLLGEFRFDAGNVHQPPSVKLMMRQGGLDLGVRRLDNPDPSVTPSFLREAALAMLAQLARERLKDPDPEAEAAELAERARRFYGIGTYREAAALAEASLIVRPGQAQMHRLAMSAYGRSAWSVCRDKPAESIALSDWALEHAEQVLRLIDMIDLNNVQCVNLFNDLSQSLAVDHAERLVGDPEAKPLYRAYLVHRREAFRRVLEAKAREGTLNNKWAHLLITRWAVGLEFTCGSQEEDLQQRRDMIATLCAPTLPASDGLTPVADFHIHDVLCCGLTDERAKTPAYEAFLAEQERLYPNHVGVRRAVSRRRQEVASIGPARFVSVKAADEKAQSAEPDEVVFRPIRWTCEGKPLPASEFRFCGIAPCGPEKDYVWGYKPGEGARAYLLDRSRGMRRVMADTDAACRAQGKPSYDGARIWQALCGKASAVVAVDAVTGQVITVGGQHGLPPFDRAVLTALAPGSVCLAGCFGDQLSRRAFVARISLGPDGTPGVRIIHEAARQLDLSVDLNRQRADPQLSFAPRLMTARKNVAGDLLVVIGRVLPDAQRLDPALLTDPSTGRTQVMSAGVESHISESSVQYRDGTAYWVTSDGIRILNCESTGSQLHCAVPEEGKLCFTTDGRVHIAGRSWWVADRLGDPFRKCVATCPVRLVDFSSVFSSTCYGLVWQASADGSGDVYEVLFSNEKASERACP